MREPISDHIGPIGTFTLYGHNITNEIISERNLCIPGTGWDLANADY